MELAQQERTAVAAITGHAHQAVQHLNTSSSALMMSDGSMDKMMRMAELMATSKATVPQHFRGSPGDCMAVVMQATQWNMNPFAVAQKTHLVNGTLGYEAQLVSAVINNSGAVLDRFHFEWFGDWEKIIGKFKQVESKTKKDDNGYPKKYVVPDWDTKDEMGLGVRVWATIRGETEPRVLELLMTQARTRNSTLWTEDPKQQLAYLAQKRWARLYAPDVILGVYTPDELQEAPPMRDMGSVEIVEPAQASDDLKAQARKAAEGGKASFQRWFKNIEEDQRALLSPMRPELEAIWIKADQARTVPDAAPTPAAAPTPSQAAAPAGQTTGQTQAEVTYTWVLAKMNAAKSEDALNVAADWMGEVNDPEERRKLSARYDERLTEIKGA